LARIVDGLAPVGRLDKASEGLLLLGGTNDFRVGGARVLSPTSHIAKTYHVQIAALADEPLLNALRAGVREGGDLLRVEHVRDYAAGERNAWLEIVLKEGKNRRSAMLEALGIEVLRSGARGDRWTGAGQPGKESPAS